MQICKECKKDTTNPKFCSRSCAAKYTNRNRDKSTYRQLEGSCKTCKTAISTRNKYCSDCWEDIKKHGLFGDATLKEVIYDRHHRSSAFALVRTRARAVAKKLNWSGCSHCDYTKHVEICHIKSIGDFSDDTLLSVINDPSNLIPLCPNCHWEFDKGLLD